MKSKLFCALSLLLFGISFISAQQSCYEQYLRAHNMPLPTDSMTVDDSYDELKKEVIARQLMRNEQTLPVQPIHQPIFLAIDTLAGTCHLLAEDGTILADVHLAMVDSTWYMWLSVDPLADKYPGSTPYLYCNGNPIMIVDHNGDSLSVSDENRSDVNSYLCAAYGNQIAGNFGYTPSNMLIYNGDIMGIENKKIKNMVTKLMEQLLTSSDVISLHVVSEDCVIPGTSIRLSSAGGAIYYDSSIYINKNAPSKLDIYKVLDAYYEHNGIPDGKIKMFDPATIDITPADMFFHEIGEYIYRDDTKDKVIDYNNQYRNLLGLPPRPYDETHNRLKR